MREHLEALQMLMNLPARVHNGAQAAHAEVGTQQQLLSLRFQLQLCQQTWQKATQDCSLL